MNENLKQRALDFAAGFKAAQAGVPSPSQAFLGYIVEDLELEDPGAIPPSPEVIDEVMWAMMEAAREMSSP